MLVPNRRKNIAYYETTNPSTRRTNSMQNPFTETYSDGTQMTYGKFALAVGIGAIGATVLTIAKIKYDDWSTRRLVKKHYPNAKTLYDNK
jgi:hypothetical protein